MFDSLAHDRWLTSLQKVKEQRRVKVWEKRNSGHQLIKLSFYLDELRFTRASFTQ